MSSEFLTSPTDTNAFHCSLPENKRVSGDHPYIPRNKSDSRSPCPALNSLANHGYIPRDGRNIGFFELIEALCLVYHLSRPFAILLTVVGFHFSGKFEFTTRPRSSLFDIWSYIPSPTLTLDLDALTERGPKKIAHDGSLVHPDLAPSDSPDKGLFTQLLRACTFNRRNYRDHFKGLSLVDIAHLAAQRQGHLSHPLSDFHKQVAVGECALAWAVMRKRCPHHRNSELEDVIHHQTVKTWFGEERLPEDWWVEGGSRPHSEVGLIEVRRRAAHVASYL